MNLYLVWTRTRYSDKAGDTIYPRYLTVLPYAYRRTRTAENWVMRTPQTLYQQVCKHSMLPTNVNLVFGYLLSSPTSFTICVFWCLARPSHYGTRTRVCPVKAGYPNHLD